jgi:hypothetical protein
LTIFETVCSFLRQSPVSPSVFIETSLSLAVLKHQLVKELSLLLFLSADEKFLKGFVSRDARICESH